MTKHAFNMDMILELNEGKDLLSQNTLDTLDRLKSGAEQVKRGTAKNWFKAHHGAVVDTVMSQPGSVWVPRNRTIDAESKATSVAMITVTDLAVNSSWRDYKGLTVLHADENNLLIGYDFNGQSWTLYTVA